MSSMEGEDRFLYFAFGSNLNLTRLQINCPSAEFTTIGILYGHRLDFDLFSTRWQGAVADIVPAENCEVIGAVWSIDSRELLALDAQEGVQHQVYRRTELKVQPMDGVGDLQCISYTLVTKKGGEMPSKLYLRVILEGARRIGLPKEYVLKLKAIKANDYDDDEAYLKAVAKQNPNKCF